MPFANKQLVDVADNSMALAEDLLKSRAKIKAALLKAVALLDRAECSGHECWTEAERKEIDEALNT